MQTEVITINADERVTQTGPRTLGVYDSRHNLLRTITVPVEWSNWSWGFGAGMDVEIEIKRQERRTLRF